MRRKMQWSVSLLAAAGLLVTAAAAQSLGDYARQQRALKPPQPAGEKVYTNDNLPTTGALSQVGQPAPSSEPLSPRAAEAAAKAEQKKAQDQKKLEAEWRGRFSDQKKKVTQLQRELDVMIRENKLRQAAYQHDIVAQTHPDEFAVANQKDQADIAAKQQELDAAKQKLEDMAEELRRAGLPSSWAE